MVPHIGGSAGTGTALEEDGNYLSGESTTKHHQPEAERATLAGNNIVTMMISIIGHAADNGQFIVSS